MVTWQWMSELMIKWRFKIPAVSAHNISSHDPAKRNFAKSYYWPPFSSITNFYSPPHDNIECSNKLKITQMGMKWTMVRYSVQFITASVPKLWLTAYTSMALLDHILDERSERITPNSYSFPPMLYILNLPPGLRRHDYEHFMTLLKT